MDILSLGNFLISDEDSEDEVLEKLIPTDDPGPLSPYCDSYF